MTNRSKSWLLVGSLSLIVLIGLMVVSYESVLAGLGRWLEVTTTIRNSDLVVALGGNRLRQDEAVRLLQDGLAKKVLFLGSDVQRRDYHCLNVEPDRAILMQVPAYSTADEAVAVWQVAKSQHLTSIIIVTSPYHLRRAKLAFESVFADSGVNLLYASAPNPAFPIESWWKTYIGRKLIVTEYIGLFYYWLTV